MKYVDTRSLLIGLALGAAAILLTAQMSAPAVQVGRYQISAVGADYHAYVIDTATGATKTVNFHSE
jgi:hypothetical protein